MRKLPKVNKIKLLQKEKNVKAHKKLYRKVLIFFVPIRYYMEIMVRKNSPIGASSKISIGLKPLCY